MKFILRLQNNLIAIRALLSAGLLMLLTVGFTPVLANQSEENWDEWQAIGQGYVARRKVPANFNKPVVERRSAQIADRSVSPGALSQKGEAVGQFYRTTQAVSSGTIDSVWIKTEGEGIFSVPIAELVSLTGRTQASIVKNAKRRRLTLTNDGQAVRWMYYPDTESIIFIGQKYETFYADENAYHLTFGRTSNSKRISITGSTSGPDDGSLNPFLETLKFEEEPDFLSSLWTVAAKPDADYWFWDYLYGGFKDSIDVPLTIPNPSATGTAQIRVTLHGWTDMYEGDEHQVYAELNGDAIGSSITWDGFNEAVLVVDFDQSLLSADGENQLSLKNQYTTDSPHPGQWLDQIEVDYLRQPVAQQGKLWLHDIAEDDQMVTGFTSDQILVIQNPDTNPVAKRDVTVFEEADGRFSVAFSANTDNQDYLVSQVESVQVALLSEDVVSSLAQSNNMADYLIISSRAFSSTATMLKDYRQSEFSNVQIAWIDDIYDEFSAGREDPFAVTEFIDYVKDNWNLPPSMIVIVGKGSIDHKDRMGYGDSFVPIVMTSTPWAITASDDRLLNGSDVASFAIGRIPITNDEDGQAYIRKMMRYAGTPAPEDTLPTPDSSLIFDAVLIADDPDEAGDFDANADVMATKLIDDLGFTSVALKKHSESPSPAISQQMQDNATWEVGLVSYDGHGSVAQVGDGNENFITAANAKNLTNVNMPIFAALTCAAGDFSQPGTTSLAGSLVLNPNGGAIAAYSPTGLSLDADAQAMGTEFFDSLYAVASNNMGQAVLDAKVNTASSVQYFMRRMYSVVGDPAVNAR